VTVFFVQLQYAVEIWQLSESLVVSSAIGILASAALTLDIAIAHWSLPHIKVVMAIAQAFTLLAALLIFAALTGYSKESLRTRASRSVEQARAIFTHLFSRGLLGAAMQFACLVAFVARPQNLSWLPFYLLASKAFLNGILYMLNAREIQESETATANRQDISSGSTIAFNTTPHATRKPAYHEVVVSQEPVHIHQDGELGKIGYVGDNHEAFEDVIQANKH